MTALRIATITAILACSTVVFAQSAVPCGETLNAPFSPNSILSIDSIPAGIEIVGTERNAIHVTCAADDMSSAGLVQVKLNFTTARAKLTLTGPHPDRGNLKVRIEVPQETDLALEMSAGEVKVEDVAGDKDINLRAGAITVSSSRPAKYRYIDASVTIGQVTVSPNGESKGGFFREFRKQNANGRHRLHAHVTTGNIVLIGVSKEDAAGAE